MAVRVPLAVALLGSLSSNWLWVAAGLAAIGLVIAAGDVVLNQRRAAEALIIGFTLVLGVALVIGIPLLVILYVFSLGND